MFVSARNIQNGLTPGSTVTINQQITNAVSLTPQALRLSSALYTINAVGTSQYLLSASIDLGGNLLTPDYLTSQLSGSAGNTNGLQFLADPFVENRLLQQAALAATGSNFVLADVENDQTAQRQALYDNAIAFASTDSSAQIGTALSETQIANLDAPVLWYVTERIDGRDVLVPTLYLPTPDSIEVAPFWSDCRQQQYSHRCRGNSHQHRHGQRRWHRACPRAGHRERDPDHCGLDLIRHRP